MPMTTQIPPCFLKDRCNSRRGDSSSKMSSVGRRTVDSLQMYSPAQPGKSETGLAFAGQVFMQPAGFMDTWRLSNIPHDQ